MLSTRIAPTPSGYLHAGNAVNFLLTDWLARAHRGRLALRIDDMDTTRLRRDFVEDVFWAVDWLGIRPDLGPRDAAQFYGEYRLDPAYLRSELQRSGLPTYACACSRRAQGARATGTPDPCRDRLLAWQPGENALRLRMEPQTAVEVPVHRGLRVTGRVTVPLSDLMPDFVLWRRDDLPSYQLASVVADRDLGVDAVVRGADLLASTAAQLLIAPALDAHRFAAGVFIHHRLLTDEEGVKLSKSRGSGSLRAANDPAARERLCDQARALGADVGISAPQRGILGPVPRA